MLTSSGGELALDDRHFRVRWNATTGVLHSIARVGASAPFFEGTGEPVVVIAGGTPAENRVPEPPRAPGQELRQGGSLVPYAQPADGDVDGVEIGRGSVYDGHEITDTGRELAVTVWQRDGAWRIGLTLLLDRVAPVLRIDVRVQCDADEPDTLDWVSWLSTGWAFEPGLFDMLGSELGSGAAKRLRSGGSLVFWRTREGAGDGEYFHWGPVQPSALAQLMGAGDLDGTEQAAETGAVALDLFMGGRTARGLEFRGGGFVLGHTDHVDARAAEVLHDYLARTGVWAMPGAPAWSEGCAILETFIGYWPMNDEGDRHSPYPTTEDLIADLPRVRALGFDTIYLMPRHPFPSYTTVSFTDLAVQYGDGEGQEARFDALVAAIHAQGMRVILDVILHGALDQEALDQQERRRAALGATKPDDDERPVAGPRTNPYDWDAYEIAHAPAWRELAPAVHPYWVEHPEWFTQLPDGRAQFTYTRSFDLRHPGFQEFFVTSLVALVRDRGIDGYRFDAPWWNQRAYRWQADAGYRPSWSTGAGRELISLLYDRIESEGLSALSFAESCDSTTAGSAHLQYPYDETPVIAGLMSQSATAAEARERLTYLRRAHAPGIAVARWIDSHDSVWWAPVGRKWKREVYGASAVHAATFLSAMRDGAFMMFSGGEAGQEAWIARLLELKHGSDVLRRGSCDERAVESDNPHVLPLLRRLGDDWRVAVTAWADERVDARLRIPGVPGGTPVVDVLDPTRDLAWDGDTLVVSLDRHEAMLVAPARVLGGA